MLKTTGLAAPLLQAAQREFARDRIVWAARPDPQRTFRSGFAPERYVAGVFFAAFSLFWMVSASGVWTGSANAKEQMTKSIPLLGGLPFVGIGLWLLSAPWRHSRRASRTLYVIADKRLGIVQQARGNIAFESIYPNAIVSMSRSDHSDGTGTLIVTLASTVQDGEDWRSRTITMHGVPEADKAQMLLEEIKAVKA